MGLKDKLIADGSNQTQWNGSDPSINPLVAGPGNGLPSSTLHSNGDPAMSYSLNGSDQSVVNTGYQEYIDGSPNVLPQPSNLDTEGLKPASSYDNTAPAEGLGRI